MNKIIKSKIDGVLLFNKPLHISSNQALQKVKHLFKAEKAGHTGTLDPMATGLLPICFGEATKFSSFLLDSTKEYIATIKLGVETTTFDAEGDIVAIKPVNQSLDQIKACLQNFLGRIIQKPPIYSALKLNGKPLYEYARSGIEVEIKSREIEILEIELQNFIVDVLTVRILCSKGTYIRTIAHDLGQKLGCGASLIGLVRTKTGNFVLNQEIDLEHLSSISNEERILQLLPLEALVSQLPKVELSLEEFNYIKNGHAFQRLNLDLNQKCCLYYKNKFLGIADQSASIFKPARLLNSEKFREIE